MQPLQGTLQPLQKRPLQPRQKGPLQPLQSPLQPLHKSPLQPQQESPLQPQQPLQNSPQQQQQQQRSLLHSLGFPRQYDAFSDGGPADEQAAERTVAANIAAGSTAAGSPAGITAALPEQNLLLGKLQEHRQAFLVHCMEAERALQESSNDLLGIYWQARGLIELEGTADPDVVGRAKVLRAALNSLPAVEPLIEHVQKRRRTVEDWDVMEGIAPAPCRITASHGTAGQGAAGQGTAGQGTAAAPAAAGQGTAGQGTAAAPAAAGQGTAGQANVWQGTAAAPAAAPAPAAAAPAAAAGQGTDTTTPGATAKAMSYPWRWAQPARAGLCWICGFGWATVVLWGYYLALEQPHC